jgi:hypothetical protein
MNRYRTDDKSEERRKYRERKKRIRCWNMYIYIYIQTMEKYGK